MTTIKDVAKYANVSVATVSRVINKKGYISEEAKKKVNDAIKSLDYVPNDVARTLYSKSSKMIGLIMPDITNPFFPELAKAVEETAFDHGYTVLFCNTGGSSLKEKSYLEVLEHKYIDGLIVTINQQNGMYQSIASPMVALDRPIKDGIPTVVSDNLEGAVQATAYLIQAGCHFIAHLRGPKGVKTSDDRAKGFFDTIRQTNLQSAMIETSFDTHEAERATYKLFKEYPQIDGIFASSDVVSAGAIKAVTHLGYQIPQDVQIIGFDGIPIGEMLSPALTTMKQPIYEMGALSVDLLIKQIENQPLDQLFFKLPTELIVRQTTK
ncbi:LacI family DNA-binding transcriptional regulator [Oceanobacillus sp. CFH 90083]|uniref:LacI family DNA-binding transcriptional regulator n=1 Tax=Oceanobacillus sp. CFH 90083 TaxID=2592336 RepID=UPI00128B87A9|nr:LacI family DNA-binding transcriptional regulator [Oceanobacillus sp. CFH 90083]